MEKTEQPHLSPIERMEALTYDERDIYRALCMTGKPVGNLYQQLGLKYSTASHRLLRAKRKLGVQNDIQAVIFYYKEYLPALWKQHKRMEQWRESHDA